MAQRVWRECKIADYYTVVSVPSLVILLCRRLAGRFPLTVFFFLPSFIFLIYDREIAMSWFKSENVLGMSWLGARALLRCRLPNVCRKHDPAALRASNPLSRNKKRRGYHLEFMR